jgi:hypothetical protein
VRLGYERRVREDSVDQKNIPGSEDDLAFPHAVVAQLDGLEAARDLIEALEEGGIPSQAISLIGAPPASEQPAAEEDEQDAILGEMARSITKGAASGAVVGGVLAGVTALAIPGIGPVIAAGLGALFGSSVGGAVGGISTAKYSSKAWTRTYEVVRAGRVAVGVHHAEAEVVEKAETIMRNHQPTEVERFNESSS